MQVGTVLKAIVAVAGAVIIAVNAAIEDGIFTSNEWFPVVIAAITAASVYLAPNKPL